MKSFLIASFAALLTVAATAEARPMAKVNNVEITEEMFTAFVSSRTQKPVAELTDQDRELLTEELIKLVAVGTEARRKKVQSDPEVAAKLQLQELSFLAQTYLQKHLEDQPVSPDKLQALYDTRYGNKPMTEYKARHILVDSPNTARQVISELEAGGDFVTLAAKYSTGPSANSGGDLGWFTRQQMVPEFADAVVALNDGAHSAAPVQTQYGWHIIFKEGQRETPPPQLGAVGQELERELQQQEIQSLVEGLRESAKVRTYQ
ncbi:MAG: peptidylprolyl isomerase [Gammaproteobacteria bacterium]|nr:peptidylprolyl isomerase [Gammaproteobacteria bacterium]NNF61931.1 peptidylprolyl isomerase [Gammaproteobacteria bacterium]NNM19765.1 peptidylprolyl isomerase [Gammaproteobacteria bacterium]